MSQSTISRRHLLATTTFLAAGLGLGTQPAQAQSSDSRESDFAIYDPENSDFPFEVQRTKNEWMELLDNDEDAYYVMRRGGTEPRKTTDLWKSAFDGDYLCRGCDLPIYEGRWFHPLDKGWVFFHHAKPHSVMFAIDGPVPQYGQGGMALNEENALTEIHCRRCGSHLGHHLNVPGTDIFLHCINGTSVKLDQTA
ncbi:MAG: peptide-methionine (R)-S-oxide reductase [Pseudomonadota bacterium]